MALLKILLAIFMLPGNLMLSKFKISEAEDGGIFRSMINMLVWGVVCIAFIVPFIR